jgi:CHAT domain-containing protein
MGLWDWILQTTSTSLQESLRSTKGSTTTLSIQKFGNIYAITSHHINPRKHFGPVAPGGAISVDEDFVKKKVISEFEALAKGEIDYEDLEAIMYNYFIPESIRDHLEKVNPSNLVIMTVTEHDIPWEFMSDGKNFWCTKYNMGRVLVQDAIQEQEKVRLAEEKLRIAVIVSDREGNLPEAKKEGETIAELLHDDPEITVRLFSKSEVTKINVLKILLRGNYDVIHYAGHADFSVSEPINSHLKLNDSKLSYDEIARLRFNKNARPVVFANACSTSK